MLRMNNFTSLNESTGEQDELPGISDLPCYLVNNLSNREEQCKFIYDNNCLEKEATFDYVHLVYCELGKESIYISIALLASLVIILFLALSSIADEFLCPNLLSVAKNLRMSDSLAGVTLLAFGNGCPDIFASIAAASSNRSELIVGELLGAGIFCTSIVAGLIFVHKDFKLARRPILRDTTFYMMAVYLVWIFCDSREVTFYGALSFILIYVIYLVVALSGQAIHSRLKGDYSISEVQALHRYQETLKEKNWYNWREESLRRRRRNMSLSRSCFEATKFPNMVIERHKNGVTTIHLGLDSLSLPATDLTSSALDRRLHSSLGRKLEATGWANEAYEGEGEQEQEQEARAEPSRAASQAGGELDKLSQVKKFNQDDLNPVDDLLAHVCPIEAGQWSEKRLLRKLLLVLRAPLLFAAIVTIPVLDYDRKRDNWCRLLNAFHCLSIPLLLTCVLCAKMKLFTVFNFLPVPLVVLLPASLLCASLLRSTSLEKPPRWHAAFAYVGFLMSVLWIYTIAREILGLLKTVGIVFNMSDTAIGLGILAWGNSLGDIVANLSLAKAGYPKMALGASIGAPLLNLLLGFGISFTLSLKPGQSSPIEHSPTITLLCSTLAIILIAIMLSTLIPTNKSKKPFGYILISGYAVYFLLAVSFEYKLINFDG